LVLVLSIAFILPLYWMFLNSLKPNVVTMQIPPRFIPLEPTLENYRYVSGTMIYRWMFNSLFVAVLRVIISLYVATMAGYALAKGRFPGNRLIFWMVIAFMIIPRQVLLLPLFIRIRNWDLLNSYPALLLPNIAWPYGVFLMRQMIVTVPNSYFESARIDGAGELLLYHRILLPLIRPALVAGGLFAFTHMWKDYLWALVVNTEEHMKTLPVGIASFAGEHVGNYGITMAASVLGSIPLIIIFTSFQKHFTSGVRIGAIKG
jgi:multiple sugar transport system permease protein